MKIRKSGVITFFVPLKFKSNGTGWYLYTYFGNTICVSESKGITLTTEQMLAL